MLILHIHIRIYIYLQLLYIIDFVNMNGVPVKKFMAVMRRAYQRSLQVFKDEFFVCKLTYILLYMYIYVRYIIYCRIPFTYIHM